MQNKATTGLKSSNILVTAWVTKVKFLYTEEYKPIDSVHIDSIFLSLQIEYVMYC